MINHFKALGLKPGTTITKQQLFVAYSGIKQNDNENINRSYQILSNPFTMAEHFLNLHGISTNDISQIKLEQSFIKQIFILNENNNLEEANSILIALLRTLETTLSLETLVKIKYLSQTINSLENLV